MKTDDGAAFALGTGRVEEDVDDRTPDGDDVCPTFNRRDEDVERVDTDDNPEDDGIIPVDDTTDDTLNIPVGAEIGVDVTVVGTFDAVSKVSKKKRVGFGFIKRRRSLKTRVVNNMS